MRRDGCSTSRCLQARRRDVRWAVRADGLRVHGDAALEARFATAMPDGRRPPWQTTIAKAIALTGGGTMRSLTGSGQQGDRAGNERSAADRADQHRPGATTSRRRCALEQDSGLLTPGEVRDRAAARAAHPSLTERRARRRATRPWRPRAIVENISPRVSGGPFAAKRIAGQTVTVEADAYVDGHDVLAVELLWKAADEEEWQRTPMTSLGNARWQARFTPFRVGRYHYTVEAWIDEYATLCRAIRLKQDAGVDISVELTKCDRRSKRRSPASPARAPRLSDVLAILQNGDVAAERAGADLARDAQGRLRCRRASLRSPGTNRSALEVEREAAGFAAWYELFPRSLTDDPAAARHLRRRDRAPAAGARHGLRRPLLPADPSDRHQGAQGPQQHA